MSHTSEWYRNRAEEARTLSCDWIGADTIKMLEEVACGYDRLAVLESAREAIREQPWYKRLFAAEHAGS